MSFTLAIAEEELNANPALRKDYESLQRAVEMITKKKVVIVCTTSDEGNYASTKKRLYPAAFTNSDQILTIGCCNADGRREFVGSRLKVDFILPGVGLPLAEGLEGPVTGSSFATALAAGTAAAIMHFCEVTRSTWGKLEGGVASSFQLVAREQITTTVIKRIFHEVMSGTEESPLIIGDLFAISDDEMSLVYQGGDTAIRVLHKRFIASSLFRKFVIALLAHCRGLY